MGCGAKPYLIVDSDEQPGYRAAMKTQRLPKRPPPRSRLEVDERRAQLLAIARKFFSENAYDEVSIDAIAAAAGISKGLLYHYFPTKRDFYVAALREIAQQLLTETTPPSSDVPVDERVRRGVETYLSFVERRGTAYVALMRGGIGSDPEIAGVLEETRAGFLARMLEHLPAGVDGALARTALRGWIGFVEATSLDWVERRAVPLSSLVELLRTMLFEAMKEVARLTIAAKAGALAQ